MATTTQLPASPSALKHMEKQIIKEGKMEANQVQHSVKDVASAEKASTKAQKSIVKAEKRNDKLNKQEASAAKALNKAEHKHDQVITELTDSDRDLKLRHQTDARLQAELATKKANADKLADAQKMHDTAREDKLREIHDAQAQAEEAH
ncbi:hypothetical protein R3P38DRAFT_3489304 [Favolaschia claudopus]|uniref:Uncharacterized protein n=1 Tax=Favolaschia claudopus TaxID=2862362 RepID=A0AAW0EAN2_9AGAR